MDYDPTSESARAEAGSWSMTHRPKDIDEWEKEDGATAMWPDDNIDPGAMPTVLGYLSVRQVLDAFTKGFLGEQDPMSRFGGEPPEGTVLRWTRTLGTRERKYTYVALRAGGKWYRTTTKGTPNPISFTDLVEDIGNCPCSMAVTWGDIKQVLRDPSDGMDPAEWYRTHHQPMTVDGDTEATE